MRTKYPEIAGTGGIYFGAPDAMKKTRTDVLSDLSSVVEFIEAECNRSETLKTSLTSVYKRYKDWSQESGYKPLGKKGFAGILRTTCKLPVRTDSGTHNQMTVFGVGNLWES